MIKLTPPMGWNSWNTFGRNVNEQVVMETADFMVSTGLFDCGYNYVVIDDCWALRERDENGLLVADFEKFPHGMKYLSDCIHKKGLKFGMYSDSGMLTCAGYPASFEHEWEDAKTFADWGVDFLKYDYCFLPKSMPSEVLYRRMALALKQTGRDILFSACTAGRDNTKAWVKKAGANMYRTNKDIYDNWKLLKELSLDVPKSLEYSSPNHFADLDMLIVGMNGEGNVGLDGCTFDEYKLHFSLWALLGSPLMIGCDIRNMDDDTKTLLMNCEAIKINQDAAHNQPFLVGNQFDSNLVAYAKILENGDLALGFFNYRDDTELVGDILIQLDLLGLPESTSKTLLLKDVWSNEQIKVTNGIFVCKIKPHSCRLFRAEIIDK